MLLSEPAAFPPPPALLLADLLDKVRVTVDIECHGGACPARLQGNDEAHSAASQWCELLLSQNIPQGAYIDVDEVKVMSKETVLLTL